MNLGAALAEARGPRLQKDAAAAVGVTINYMSLMECNRRVPSFDVLVKLAAHYGRPLSGIIARAEQLPSHPAAGEGS